MKKTLLVAFIACTAVMFGSCNKEKELSGTKWATHTSHSQELTYMGITAKLDIVIDGTMQFTSATAGTMTLKKSGSVLAMGATIPLDTEETTYTFAYTFDGEAGTLALHDDEATIATPFTYNKKDNTIAITHTERDNTIGLELTIAMVFSEEK